MLFLLKDHDGRALIMAHSNSKAEADRFGRDYLPEFVESIEIDQASRVEAEEFWGVRTVRLVHVLLDPEARPRKSSQARPRPKPALATTHVWVRGLELPDDVETAGLLTQEDYRDLTLNHIAQTSDFVGRIEIRKRS